MLTKEQLASSDEVLLGVYKSQRLFSTFADVAQALRGHGVPWEFHPTPWDASCYEVLLHEGVELSVSCDDICLQIVTEDGVVGDWVTEDGVDWRCRRSAESAPAMTSQTAIEQFVDLWKSITR